MTKSTNPINSEQFIPPDSDEPLNMDEPNTIIEYPPLSTRLEIPYSIFMKNPVRSIRQLLGQNITIKSYETNDIITSNDSIIVDVKYTSIPFSLLRIYYIKTSEMKRLMPNSEKYVITINGCNVIILSPHIKDYPKILPVRIRARYLNNFSTTGQLEQQFSYYGTTILEPMNSLCTPLKYINHAFEPFETETIEPLYPQSFRNEFIKNNLSNESLKNISNLSKASNSNKTSKLNSSETSNSNKISSSSNKISPSSSSNNTLLQHTINAYKNALSKFNSLSSIDNILFTSNFSDCKLGTTGYVIPFSSIPKPFRNINGIILIQPKRIPDYILFCPNQNFTICPEELESIENFLIQDEINYYNFKYVREVLNKV